MIRKSMLLKQSILFLSIFAVSGGATMFMLYEKSSQNAGSNENETVQPSAPIEMTPAQKLINSVMTYQSMDLKGDISISKKDHPFNAKLSLDGHADISDLDAIKLQAKLGVDASGAHVDTRLTYYGEKSEETGEVSNTMYMDFNDSHFKLADAALTDVTDMIPTTGGVKLPPIFEKIDISSFVGQITDMVPSEVGYADGIRDGVTKYVFKLPELLPGLDLYLKSDDQWNFSGVLSNNFLYEGFFFKIAFDITGQEQAVTIENPEKVELAPKYQDFRPALNLFPGLKNVFGKEQNTINIGVGINVPGTNGGEPTLINVDTDLSYDTLVGDFSAAVNINENERDHSFKLAFADGTMYLNQEEVNKVYFSGMTLDHLMNYLQREFEKGEKGQVGAVLNNIAAIANNVNVNNVIEQIKKVVFISSDSFQATVVPPSQEEQTQQEQQLNNTLDQVMKLLNTVQNVNEWVKAVDVNEGQTIVHLDLTQFGLNAQDMQLIFNTAKEEFLGLNIKNLDVNGVGITLNVNPKAFNIFRVSDEQKINYFELDPIVEWIPGILDLASRNAFGITIHGTVADQMAKAAPTTIEGGFQFNLLKKYGYGNATITASNGDSHVIKADCKENSNLLINYNNLKGYMHTSSLLDMGKTIADLMMGLDEGFNNAFMEVLSTLSTTPIFKAMHGDVGAALFSDAFKIESLEHAEDASAKPGEMLPIRSMTIAINGKLMGMDGTFIKIKLVADKGLLKSIEIPELSLDGTSVINMSLEIGKYDIAKDNTDRLEFFEEGYLNLNDMKVLLKLGIKTTTFEYYHLTGQIKLKLIGIEMSNFIINVNATVRNNKGKVEVAARMPSIPKLYIPFVGQLIVNNDYDNLDGRGLSFTYKEGMVYGSREDRVSDGLFGRNKRTVIYRVAATETNFTSNLMYYLLDYGFGLNPTILKKITDGTKPQEPTTPTEQTHYEDMIKGFAYTKGETGQKADSFQIDLDLSVLTKNNLLTNCKAFLYSNLDGTYINRIRADLQILAGVLDASVDLNMDSDVDANAFAQDMAGLVAAGNGVPVSDGTAINVRLVNSETGETIEDRVIQQ